jgi:hypothetical protein
MQTMSHPSFVKNPVPWSNKNSLQPHSRPRQVPISDNAHKRTRNGPASPTVTLVEPVPPGDIEWGRPLSR